ncbi:MULTISPECIES: hypothetical protein [unclassified Microcoleus]|uniref:hypothetical protein n=1 Tax=unclassified Microcoleus TaxID=2642155 RepID=UPI002FD1E9E4
MPSIGDLSLILSEISIVPTQVCHWSSVIGHQSSVVCRWLWVQRHQSKAGTIPKGDRAWMDKLPQSEN